MDQNDAAAKKLGLSKNSNGHFQLELGGLLMAIGGWLGLLESALPGLVFITTLSLTKDRMLSVTIAAAVSIAFLIFQLVRKRPVTQVLAGAFGVALTYFLVKTSNNAADYFLTGIFTNIGYGSAMLLSILIRWPLIGLLAGLLRGEGLAWRKTPKLMRRYSAATAIWVGIFGARSLVQVTLYFADEVTLLGIMKTVMGLPLYGLGIWLTWLAIRSSVKPVD